MRRYEAMFLFDNAVARDWASIEQEVRRLCDRCGAELLACAKFDERKLAYEIKRRKRGTYVLTYFDAPLDRIGELERDARLSEMILRLLVVRADGVSEEKLAQLKSHPPETAFMPLSSDGHRHDYGRHGSGERRLAGPGQRDRERERRGDETAPVSQEAPAEAADSQVPSAAPTAESTAEPPADSTSEQAPEEPPEPAATDTQAPAQPPTEPQRGPLL